MKKTMWLMMALCLMVASVACAGNADAVAEDTRILVAYFSCTGNTATVAGVIADVARADLHEIVPEEPYTDEDLNYRDNTTRSSIEMNDPAARPAIADEVEDMAQYDIIFVGYPIWWGVSPRIVSTFIKSYDFAGKTIIPFCTSGSSGFGTSDAALKEATPDANWLEGRRFGASDSPEEIGEWLETLTLSQGK